MRIAVRGNGKVVVSAPPGIGHERIAALVKRHEQWISRAVLRCQKRLVGLKVARETFDRRAFASAVMAKVQDRYEAIAAPQGLRLGRVSVKKMRSRWGSCSGRGNISVNLLLGHLPDELLEYVVVHEVCHLLRHDHSKAFWSLVASHLPDHRFRKIELRRFGYLLSAADDIRG